LPLESTVTLGFRFEETVSPSAFHRND